MSLFFTAPGLLWLLPLAALPVVFHIRARTKERAVDFPGAFFLMNPALPSAERRRQVEDLALLSLRALLLAAAVLALSGPRVKGWAVASTAADPQAGREAIALVLDDSPSLSQRQGTGTPSWPETRQQLARILASDPRRRVTVETTSGAGWPLSAVETVASRLSEAPAPSRTSGDRTLALTRARAALQDATEDRRVVILVTDPFTNQAEGESESLRARWTSALKAFSEPGAPPLIAVTSQRPPLRQWRVEILDAERHATASERVPVAGQPFRVRVRVRCLSGAGRRVLRVETATWRFDAKDVRENLPAQPVLERPLILAEGEVVDVEIPLLSAVPAALWVGAQLDDADEWPYDDVAEAAIQVRPKRLAVLWDTRVERQERDLALQSVVFAIDPFSGADHARATLLRHAEPRAEDARAGALLAMLYGPEGPRLPQAVAEQLRGAVEAGATILWIPDLTGTPGKWTAPLPARVVASDPLLPRALEGAEAQTGDGNVWRIADAQTSHPLLRPFANGRNGDLPGVQLRRRMRLAIQPDGARSKNGTGDLVLARFNDGLPALVAQRLGAGWLCQMAFGPEPKGGLADSAAWPILLSEFLELAAEDGLGTPPSEPVSPTLSSPVTWTVAPSSAARTARLAGPWHPKPGALQAEPAHRWTFEIPALASEVRLPPVSETGLYRLTVQGREAQRFVACRIALEESSPEGIPNDIRELLAKTARESGGAAIADLAQLSRALADLQPGRPLAPLCWGLFGVLMAAELGLLIWRGRSA